MKFFIASLFFLMTLSCGNANNALPQKENTQETQDAPVKKSVSNDNKEPVYMTLPQTTFDKNVGTVTLTLFNTSENICITGYGYFIEKNEKGQWMDMPLRNGAFHEIGISIPTKASKEMNVNLANVKVKYSSGLYRVGKRIRIQSENGYRDTVCYCNFYIR